MALVTVEQAKTHLNDANADETELARYIAAAHKVVGTRCPAALVEPGAGDVVWDHVVRSDVVILPQPMRALVSVTAYSGGVGTAYAVTDITATAPTYGYSYNEAAGLLHLSPMPYGSTVRVVYTPGLDDDARATAELAALKLVRFWWQPTQNGYRADGPSLDVGGGGTGNVVVAGYLVPNAVAALLDAISPRGSVIA